MIHEHSALPDSLLINTLRIRPLTTEGFSPFGQVMAALEDGVPFSPQDAQLHLSEGTPRFYTMKIPGRGYEFTRITRHRAVTQALASVGGKDWVIAVAPPLDLDVSSAEPRLEDIVAFRIPGDVAIMLSRGTWHAGPLFEEPFACFFNLELSDTNIIDHHTCDLAVRYGTSIQLVA